eukprot:CAMPEP_0198113226 /NCGR_PEP_ID=MMETSP1442-20131203/4952_1 /TAXON_ID= /ORGANISM="Craspedostauros australis, Strain CCMP3328" /LENGTH=474 /DNA_ID=CAMNT_0043770267 /DNA_START=46 /DNA_END=1470 /DNA_ORIENTATION=+
MPSSNTPSAIMGGANTYRVIMATAIILALMNFRLSVSVTSTASSQLVDAATDDVTNPRVMAHRIIPHWNRNITDFPSFMLQWPADESSRLDECNILDATIPHVFNFTNYPRSYEPKRMFRDGFGNFSEAWDQVDAASGRGVAGANASVDRNTSIVPIKAVGCSLADYKNAHHFPHQMEIVYRCWSLWRHFPHARHALLIRPKMYQKFVARSAFSSGMKEVLTKNNIPVRSENTRAFKRAYKGDWQEVLIVFAKQTWDFKAAREDDMDNLRRSALPALGLHRYVDQYCGRMDPTEEKHRSMTIHNEEGNDSTRIELPRIVIVNRKTRRQLLGAHNMSSILQDELKLPYKPPVLYFETLSFKEQVEAFNNVDILLSPHGAHLTGIPFMQRCSSVIEVFPHGYGGVDYFGSLSAISGVNHTYIYLGMDRIAETKNMSSHKDAETARSASLCAPAHSMVEAVKIQIERWNSCCESQHP